MEKKELFVYIKGFPVGKAESRKGDVITVRFDSQNGQRRKFNISKCDFYNTLEELKQVHPEEYIPYIGYKEHKEFGEKFHILTVEHHPITGKLCKLVGISLDSIGEDNHVENIISAVLYADGTLETKLLTCKEEQNESV